MVLRISVLTIWTMVLAAVSVAAVLFTPLYWVAAVTLMVLFAVLTMSIPVLLAWNKLRFRGVVWTFVVFMAFSVFVFALIYDRTGLVVGDSVQDVSLGEAVYFSVTTWATLGYGDYTVPRSAQLITSAETVMGYLSMGVFIAVLAMWVSAGLQAHLKYLQELPDRAREAMRELSKKSPELKKEFEGILKENETDT